MVWAKLFLDTLAVLPDRPYLGAAVVVFVANPAAAAVVVLVANDQADVVRVQVVIARNDLAARCLFGREMDLCANHRSLPSRWQESFVRPAGDRPVAQIAMRVCRRLPAPRSCPDAHRRPLPFCSRNQICPRLVRLMRRGLFRTGGVGGWPGYAGFKQRAAYVGNVHN